MNTENGQNMQEDVERADNRPTTDESEREPYILIDDLLPCIQSSIRQPDVFTPPNPTTLSRTLSWQKRGGVNQTSHSSPDMLPDSNDVVVEEGSFPEQKLRISGRNKTKKTGSVSRVKKQPGVNCDSDFAKLHSEEAKLEFESADTLSHAPPVNVGMPEIYPGAFPQGSTSAPARYLSTSMESTTTRTPISDGGLVVELEAQIVEETEVFQAFAVQEVTKPAQGGESLSQPKGKKKWISAISTVVMIVTIVTAVLVVKYRKPSNNEVMTTSAPTVAASPAPSVQEVEWVQLGQTLTGVASYDQFGTSVALSGNGTIMASGAVVSDYNQTVDSGQVHVFVWDGARWQNFGSPIGGVAAEDHFGTSVSLSFDGLTLAIGADKNDNGGVDTGHVQVFKFDGSDWQQNGLDLVGAEAYSQFGFSIALSGDGNIVASGALVTDAGHVQVFQFSSREWQLLGSKILGKAKDDHFGNSVSLSFDGLTLAIGADLNNNEAGYVQVFSFNGTDWQQVGQDLNGTAGEKLGFSVALAGNGTILAAGAPLNDYNGTDSGAVHVYVLIDNQWSQMGNTIFGEVSYDKFGIKVDISFDGLTLVAGAPMNEENDFVGAGKLRVFHFDGQDWQKVGQDVDGKSTSDRFGSSVSISGDGTIIVGGAPFSNNGGSEIGNVRIFSFDKH